MAKNKLKDKKRAEKNKRITPLELEAEVREYLGSAGIHPTKEIAEGLKRDRGAVYRACNRLYSAGVLRLSRIPKYLYRFALTGEVLHGDNFPVITRLMAKVRAISRESRSIQGNPSNIFAELRNLRQLKTTSRLKCIDKCEKAARAIRSDERLLQQMSLYPFQTKLIRWWPQSLENEYIEPMQGVVEKLNKTRILNLTRRFPQLYLSANAQVGSNPSTEEKEAKKVILQTLNTYGELREELKVAGIDKLLTERDSQLSQIAAKETILKDDLKVTTEMELEKGLEVARNTPLDEERFGDGLLIRIDPYLLGKHLDSLRTRKSWGWKKWLVSSAQIAWGGALLGFDLSLAFGLVLPGVGLSIAGVNVGVSIALAGSVHTGGKNVLDALKEMAEELEKHKQNSEKEISIKGVTANL